MNQPRCTWVSQDPIYLNYHDQEWGIPVYDDRLLFEYLILEGMQAGLSWLTILKKRAALRLAFDHFDPSKIIHYTEQKTNALMANHQIIRHRLKIAAVKQNAIKYLEIQQIFGQFSHYVWQFVEGKPILNQWKEAKDVPITTKQSDHFANDLKQRGFKFVGSTICYAFMQAVGMVNDHTVGCFKHPNHRSSAS